MKKLSILLLVFVLVTALAVSCSAELSSNDSLATISFVDSSAEKSLVASNQNYSSEADEYFVWYYTAKKAGNTNGNISTIKYGETEGDTYVLLGDDGKLSNSLTLSLGYWEFSLKAYLKSDVYTEGTEGGTYATDLTGKTAMYEAETGPVLVEKQANNEDQTITVTIVNTMTSGTKGKLLLDSNIKLVNKDGDAYDSIEITDMTFTYTQLNGLTTQDGGTLTPGTEAEVYSGTYKVVASYTATETTADDTSGTSVTYASTEIIVNVYDDKVTTITGTLDEITQSVTFDFKVGCKVLISQSVETAEALKTGYTYKVSIADLTDSSKTTKVYATDSSTISITDSTTGSFTLTQYDNDAISKLDSTTEWRTVTAKDSNNVTKTYGWNFESNNFSVSKGSIIVESYIGTGLTITSFKIIDYQWDSSDSGSVDRLNDSISFYHYDSTTGYISFVIKTSES